MILFDKYNDAMTTRKNRFTIGLSVNQRERTEVYSPSFLTFEDGCVEVYNNEIHYLYKDNRIISELKEKLDQ
jgi:hypothetical protein